jgi:hypothetical protein
MRIKKFLLKNLFWILVIIAGSGYGLLGYAIFDKVFSHNKNSGVMLASYLIGIPFSGSATISYFLAYKEKSGFIKIIISCLLVLLIGSLVSIELFHEGSICIVMLMAIAIIPSLLGITLGACIAQIRKINSRNTLMSIVAILPFAFGGIEQNIAPQDVIYSVKRNVFIKASPETVWGNIIHPTNIKPYELKDGIAYKIGVPYPLEAQVLSPSIGGIRKSVWERGVKFDEEITAFEKNKYIEWIYHFGDDSFPSGSLDNHVKIGGTYFDLKNTSYSLMPENNGTKLEISVRFRVTTNFNWYAVPLANYFIGDTSDTLLNFYKNRSEITAL